MKGTTSHPAAVISCGPAGRGMDPGHGGMLFLQVGVLDLPEFFKKEWI